MGPASGSLRRVAGLPLAATLAAHALMLLWLLGDRRPANREDGVAVSSLFVPLRPTPPVRQQPLVTPARPRPPAPPRQAAPADAPVAPEPTAEPLSATIISEAPIAPDAFEQAGAPVAEATSETRSAAGLLEHARRQAGAVDRSLRNSASAVPRGTSTAWSTFERRLASAHVDRSRGVSTQSYVSPDGTVVYRHMRNGQAYCRTGGSVRPRIGGAEGGGAQLFDSAGGGGAAGQIRCPDVEWQKH